jgi:hypothetical protein
MLLSKASGDPVEHSIDQGGPGIQYLEKAQL